MITQIVRYALAHVLALAAFVVAVPFEGQSPSVLARLGGRVQRRIRKRRLPLDPAELR
jgi:hypothetical protein